MPSFLLPYYPPYDWVGTLQFLKGRLIKDVEMIVDSFYARTVRIGKYKGEIQVMDFPKQFSLQVTYSASLDPVLSNLKSRVSSLFDLAAQPRKINARLKKHPMLKVSAVKIPGLRVPGAFDAFEMAVRAILGQQITVKAATTLSCRFADAFGEKIKTSFGSELSRITPQAEKVATLSLDDIAKLGIISARAKSIIAIAQAFASGSLVLKPGMDPEATISELVKIPGIGPWTAHYIAMRSLNFADAFPKEDIAVQKAMGGVTAKEADQLSQPWRPYRSYAVLHLWKILADIPKIQK